MITAFNTDIQLQTLNCWVCGCGFAVDYQVYQTKKRKQETLHCPNGCRLSLAPPGKSAREKELERELATAKRMREYYEADSQRERKYREQAERSLSATRGVVTRMKRRAANGVCPCCNRSFENLKQHMQTKHPEFADEKHTG